MRPVKVSVAEVIEDLSAARSAWHRMDILRAITDRLRPQPGMSGARWAHQLDRAVERVLEHCVVLDPDGDGQCRVSDGRSVWIEPVAPQVTSEQILAQETGMTTDTIAKLLHEWAPDPMAPSRNGGFHRAPR